ncbi:FAD-binding oxidoreductase [Alcaligenaceae bacterium SJ-26]|nr:FAD-binding oxidoreductase [Alcaligenaceae bacterium SJ-26]
MTQNAEKELLEALRQIVGRPHAVSGHEAPESLIDQLQRYEGEARAVVRPGSTEEVARVVALLAGQGIPIVPQGGNTGLVGAATPDGSGRAVVLSSARLNRIRDIDLDNDTITVEAGVRLGQLREAAHEAGRWFPLSLPSQGSCTVGGNLGTNAGGTQVIRFGNMRALTLGLEVVTAQGEIWHGLRGLRKDNTGYDLRDLFIGSEGTLGIITAATLKLFPLPRAERTAFLRVTGLDTVLALLRHARAGFGAALTSFEIIARSSYDLVSAQAPEYRLPFLPDETKDSWYVLIEISDENDEAHADLSIERVLGEALENGLAQDVLVADSLAQREAFWALREHGLGVAQRRDGKNVKHDISLPISRIPTFVRESAAMLQRVFPGVRIFAHGHAGDGNLHYNVAAPTPGDDAFIETYGTAIRAQVHDLVIAHHGSISAEHGIGQSKLTELLRCKSPVEIGLMRQIKQAFDPGNLLNPGKVLAF